MVARGSNLTWLASSSHSSFPARPDLFNFLFQAFGYLSSDDERGSDGRFRGLVIVQVTAKFERGEEVFGCVLVGAGLMLISPGDSLW